MRASHLHSNVQAIDALGEDDARAVKERCKDAIAEAEWQLSVAWLPLELDIAITGAVDAVCGETRLRQWSADAIAATSRTPLLRPMLGALRRLGLTPHSALKRAPYGWDLIYKHCGALRYEREDDTTASLWLEGAPARMLDAAYMRGMAGTFDGVIEIGGGEDGHCALEPHGDAMRLLCTWR